MHVNAITRPLSGLLLLLAATLAHAGDFGLQDLMQMLGQHKSGTATFVEKKYIAMLNQPLESSGELSFTAPDKLEKRTLKPKPEAVTLQGNVLQLERSDGRRMKVSLSDRPEVAAFVESIRATLAGDRSALERFYGVAMRGTADQWQLTLVPLQPRMLKVINQIRIGGNRAQVRSIVFMQADGDHSEMTITGTTGR
jgi:hypothetical protein